MPLVVVQYKSGRLKEDILQKLAEGLPKIVAKALHVEENPAAHLTPNDVEVWVRKSGKLDVNTKDLEIIIWAKSYPERLQNLEERKDAIVRSIRAAFWGRQIIDRDLDLSSFSGGYVWVLLQPAAYGKL